MDKKGNLHPSAFIPFCDLGENISILGKNINGLNTPVCNSFEEKFLNNQLCYEIDVNQFKNEVESNEIIALGLTFIVDTNKNRQVERYQQKIILEKTPNIGKYFNKAIHVKQNMVTWTNLKTASIPSSSDQ